LTLLTTKDVSAPVRREALLIIKQKTDVSYDFVRFLSSQWNKFGQILRVSRTMKPPADDFQASKLGRARIQSEVEIRIRFTQGYGVHVSGDT
jgi:hypothetical protein